jgi:hypothetical protein
MNRIQAKELAETLTVSQIKEMLDNAKAGVKDWTKASVANKGISRGSHWNIFCKDYSTQTEFTNMHKYRLIQEYGEFLPYSIRHKEKSKKDFGKPVHHDPIF